MNLPVKYAKYLYVNICIFFILSTVISMLTQKRPLLSNELEGVLRLKIFNSTNLGRDLICNIVWGELLSNVYIH